MQRFFITGLGIGQVVSWGTIYYAFPVVADRMGIDLGATRTELYVAATIAFLVAAVAAYPVGAWIDRGHGRIVMSVGAALSALLLFAWSQATSLSQLYLLFAGIGIAQALCLYEPAFAVVARRYGRDARSGITALTLWGGFASTVFVPLTEFLAERFGWRNAIASLGAINLLFALVPYLLVIRANQDVPLEHAEAPAARGPVHEAIRTPSFWALLVAFVSYYCAFMVVTYHLYPLLRERGFDAATVVTAIALIGPAQVAGRVVMWAVAARISVAQLGIAIFVGFPLALYALAVLPTVFAWLVAWAIFHGAINGVMTIVRGLAVPELVTRRAYGTVNALLAAPSNVVKALAPLGAAIVWQASESYGPVLAGCILISVVGTLGFGAAVALARRTHE
ncbi:MFS transporter [Roseiterribacter gracilis]|uniref:Putative transporter, MFS family protein n=1 Tax=Roseiterribacter gracilis TaxID=2812848 RepID=A0A8S8X9H3_9PROT|nr:putative transporter, MFS family protein [Rhodospirillales bacterium TMPK1]